MTPATFIVSALVLPISRKTDLSPGQRQSSAVACMLQAALSYGCCTGGEAGDTKAPAVSQLGFYRGSSRQQCRAGLQQTGACVAAKGSSCMGEHNIGDPSPLTKLTTQAGRRTC